MVILIFSLDAAWPPGYNVCKTQDHSARLRDSQGRVSWFCNSLEQTYREKRETRRERLREKEREGDVAVCKANLGRRLTSWWHGLKDREISGSGSGCASNSFVPTGLDSSCHVGAES